MAALWVESMAAQMAVLKVENSVELKVESLVDLKVESLVDLKAR